MGLEGVRIAVTGATGFLGRYVVDSLLRRGAHVVGVVRNPGRVPELAARGVELRQADLAEPERLAAGFAGVDAIVANAALFVLGNSDWRAHQRANIAGTENTFAAAAAAGVKRAVLVSSCGVYRGFSRDRIGEDYPQYDERTRRNFTNVYRISKALSEQLAWRLAAQHGTELTAVRPCAIYGAFDANFTRLFKRLVGGPVGIMPAPCRLSVVYGGDVAEGIAACLERPATIGRAYNLAGEDWSLPEVLRAWEQAGGRTARIKIPVPAPIYQRYHIARAERELGWRNRPLVDGWRDTLAREGGDGRSRP